MSSKEGFKFARALEKKYTHLSEHNIHLPQRPLQSVEQGADYNWEWMPVVNEIALHLKIWFAAEVHLIELFTTVDYRQINTLLILSQNGLNQVI